MVAGIRAESSFRSRSSIVLDNQHAFIAASCLVNQSSSVRYSQIKKLENKNTTDMPSTNMPQGPHYPLRDKSKTKQSADPPFLSRSSTASSVASTSPSTSSRFLSTVLAFTPPISMGGSLHQRSYSVSSASSSLSSSPPAAEKAGVAFHLRARVFSTDNDA